MTISKYVFFDNNVGKRFLTSKEETYRKSIWSILGSPDLKSGTIGIGCVRTVFTLLEGLGISRKSGFGYPSPTSKLFDLKETPDEDSLCCLFEEVITELRLKFEALGVNENTLKSKALDQYKHIDNSSDLAKSLFENYYAAVQNNSKFAELFVDSLASAQLQKGLKSITSQGVMEEILAASLSENYAGDTYPLIISPYRTVYFLAKKLSEKSEWKEIEKASLKSNGDDLDAEIISVAVLGTPGQQSANGKVFPVTVITADENGERILRRAKLFNHTISLLQSRSKDSSSKMTHNLRAVFSRCEFASGEIVQVDKNTGSELLRYTAQHWS